MAIFLRRGKLTRVGDEVSPAASTAAAAVHHDLERVPGEELRVAVAPVERNAVRENPDGQRQVIEVTNWVSGDIGDIGDIDRILFLWGGAEGMGG